MINLLGVIGVNNVVIIKIFLRLYSYFNVSIKEYMKTIIKYCCSRQLFNIARLHIISEKTVRKTTETLIKDAITILEDEKFRGSGFIVEICETMLNNKCESHKEMSSTNKKGSLCVVELGTGITRGYTKVVINKKAEYLIPIICS
ncbi:hypothetical protein H311_00672 [Anncaliia algerae PRA109]|nr:hypothetical protein H311_00672 [Anncaliia algerae PRA109]